jgi:hypothetical protein
MAGPVRGEAPLAGPYGGTEVTSPDLGVQRVVRGGVLAGPVRTAEPERVLVMKRRTRVSGYRTPERVQYVFGWRTWVLACLAWMFVGLPVVACALGWALR